MAKQEYPILTTFRFPPSGDDCTSKISVRSTHSEVSSDTASPTSDATLFEDAPLCPVSPSGCGEDSPDCTDHNDILGKRLSAKCANQVKDYELTPISRRYVRHCRHISSSSAVDVAEILPTSLRSRAKTDDGLFLFRANPFKEPIANVHRGRHRQRISLNLPVNSHAGQRSGTQQSRQPDTENLTQPLVGDEAAYPATKLDTWPAEERDLEYKHRHTLIGTASLDDFIEILEISRTHTTTKGAVARAFVQLASAEQLYARQCSTRNNGWELITRTSLTVMDVTSVDYIVQLRVKLGSITLRQFLDLIPFDEVDEAAAVHVIEAFSIASHMDTTAAIGTTSKAKAFRSWLVKQMKVDAGH
ncbi:hypothetical protein AG0111_0g2355 [Alternaria gaisen]|uniref:Uncharacterized protein n=1 Tax=Alternaria gaisen TaxID=167740 RepID=A0ACB6G2H0_9PLEO|nr:hypothetical protein AG0111_0g2355 [Alternaria gaisen]